jgi:lipoate-protein ligase A
MQWRLILDKAACGAWNMAVDEALLLSHAAGDAPPTLRFYDWEPACISIGRFQETRKAEGGTRNSQQKAVETHHSPLTTHHFDLVRRPTGGRAVLHQHEITYCAVVNEALLPCDARSVVGAYRWLSTGLAAGLHTLGVNAVLAKPTPDLSCRASAQTANCFSSAARCDFLVGEKKLIGAAQCRKRGVILQHGSLLLEMDGAAWEAAIGGSMDAVVSLQSLGVTASRPTIIAALGAGLESTLDISLCEGVLDAGECTTASRLHREKYTQHAWNHFGDCG